MAPSSKAKTPSKPAGKDIRGFFGGGSSSKPSGSAKSGAVAVCVYLQIYTCICANITSRMGPPD